MSLSEIHQRWFAGEGASPPQDILQALAADARQGARDLVARTLRRRERQAKQQERGRQLLQYENVLWSHGLNHVAGIDEAGMGPLAGPVVAAAVILPPHTVLPGLDDSKKLTHRQRQALFDTITGLAVGVGVGRAEPDEVDRINVYQAGLAAMTRAVAALPCPPDHLLIDARNLRDLAVPQQSLIRGDSRSASIAAASVIAKVTRDRVMEEMDTLYPGYGFRRHKGYPTSEHRQAMARLGRTPIHRKSFISRPPAATPSIRRHPQDPV
jgi:ribonuclease HII